MLWLLLASLAHLKNIWGVDVDSTGSSSRLGSRYIRYKYIVTCNYNEMTLKTVLNLVLLVMIFRPSLTSLT